MFWADRIAQRIQETVSKGDGSPLVIRDEKTISGRVHIGSMRGVAIHGVVGEALTEQGVANVYRYELNDFDDFDTVPGYLPEEVYKEHLGKPLFAVPSPEPGFANFAEYYGAEFIEAHKKAGFFPEYYRAYKDLYAAGKMDAQILAALSKAADVRRILKEVSGSVKDESWLPISIVCESCGKIKTTRAYDFDGATVAYTCDQTPYGSVACGHVGRVAPTGGRGKLFWKVDWAAKWVANDVAIEGGGKDHSTKGGSRDVANHIAREIFNREPPFDIPYEFFLVGGKKMSSSKGRGSSAREMSELFPPELFRLVLLGKDINQQIDVDPEGDSIPRMYDWYDDLAEQVRAGVADDFTRLFALCHAPRMRAGALVPWQMRFSQVAFIVQMPHLDLPTEAAAAKGSPLTEDELSALHVRAAYAHTWLTTYAPESYKYALQETLPGVPLSEAQKEAMRALHTFFAEGSKTGEQVHERLHALKTEIPIAPKELFVALYQLFLHRDSGPKAGWFLSVLPHEFVLARLAEAAA